MLVYSGNCGIRALRRQGSSAKAVEEDVVMARGRGMEIVRLKARDYDEWLWVLNTVFTKQNKREMDFEKELPKMCVKDDEHMGKHFAVKDNGKIYALVGIYTLPVKCGNKELMFSTVGNVATLPEQEGKGYMRMLMKEAMRELDRIGADASRLGGVRQRYNRYGYEMCGMEYSFVIDDFTTRYCFNDEEEIVLKEISANDKKQLAFINFLRKSLPMHVQRSADDTFFGDFATLCIGKNVPYIAENKQGNTLGYLSVSGDLKKIAEVNAVSLEALKKILFYWQKNVKKPITFALSPLDTEAVKYFSQVAADMKMASPCLFKIINYDKVANALIKQKASNTQVLCNGERIIGIKEWGNIRLYHKDGEAFCEKTDRKADFMLDKLTASRFLFGPFMTHTVVDSDEFLSQVLPLPLGWSKLDRV